VIVDSGISTGAAIVSNLNLVLLIA